MSETWTLDPAERSDPVYLEGLRQERRERAALNADLRASALLEALKALTEEVCDYARINNLGDPEAKHNVKLARAAIAFAEGRRS